jgi:transcriptional regulator GlxA family with amidase domain
MLKLPVPIREGSAADRLRRGLQPVDARRTVETMAQRACFSRRQFHRLTVRTTGEAPAAYQRRLRLDRGAWRLLTSRSTILAIALETGWRCHESFTRAFYARFGLSPSAFRGNFGHTLPWSIRTGLAFAVSTTLAKKSS